MHVQAVGFIFLMIALVFGEVFDFFVGLNVPSVLQQLGVNPAAVATAVASPVVASVLVPPES